MSSVPHDRSHYEGRNLAWLLLALFGPAFILFLKIVVSLAESGGQITARQIVWMNRLSYLFVGLFFLLELFCARYVQRLLRPARTHLADAVQYAGVLLLCLFTSYIGAVVCEAFGYEAFLRVMRR